MEARFLLAQLHMDSLRDKTSIKSVKKALETLPEGVNGLDLAYDGALRRIESQRDGFRLLAKRLLGWLTYSKRLMTITEVQHALAIEPDTLDLDKENLSDLDEIVSFCAGLVIVDEETQIIRLVHYTTQEYLRRNGDRILTSAQQDIAVSCLTYLLYNEFGSGWLMIKRRRILNLKYSIKMRRRLEGHPFLDYAARYWAIHAGVCGQRNINELMMRFARDDCRVSTASQVILFSDKLWDRFSDVDGTRTRSPLSAMHLIAYLGDEHAMSILLNQGFEVNALDAMHRTPLWWAALQGHHAVVNLLLAQKNVNLNSRGFFHNRADDQRYTETALGVAVCKGNDMIVKRLIECEDVDVNLSGDHAGSPLVSAAEEGHSAIVELLLTRKDIEVNSRNHLGRTPLWCAAKYGQEDIVRELLNIEDTQVNCLDEEGYSPLAMAAHQGHEDVVKLLLCHADIDLNTKDDDGETALHSAARWGYAPVVKLLSAHPDVELNPTNNEGRDVFALVSEQQKWYSKRTSELNPWDLQRIKDLEECLEILRAAIEKRSQERSRVMREEDPQ